MRENRIISVQIECYGSTRNWYLTTLQSRRQPRPIIHCTFPWNVSNGVSSREAASGQSDSEIFIVTKNKHQLNSVYL